ncbi:glycosyltransferase family 4 protein [Pseudarthrobacter enclensis]|uniref:glycosyltransferase family 4 protein n=1 Tax=Pseudarthrobacter enclensis TaxID=993070 RepID=UPI0036AAE5D5
MKIVFDAYWSTNGPPSGRMVVNELLRAWAENYPEDELKVLLPANDPGDNVPHEVSIVRSRLRPHGLAVATLSRYSSGFKADAVITQNFAVKGSRSCVFLHDAIFQSHPQYFTRRERLYFRWLTSRLRFADLVFTSSATEAARIVRHNPNVSEVHPVGLAIGANLLGAAAMIPEEAVGLDGFVLAVGRLNVRKNLITAFRAAGSSSQISTEHPLLVVGERDGKQSDLPVEITNLIEEGKIRFLGGVTDSNLRWLYENASVLVFPSLDEGFGLPPLEALHFGCPLILSDIPVFRELYSQHAQFVAPLDYRTLAAAIDNIVSSGHERSGNNVVANPRLWADIVRSMRNKISERVTGEIEELSE